MIKLKDLLLEELVGNIKGYEVYKNPKSIKRMAKDLRALSFPNGDFYVVDDSMHIIHDDMVKWLKLGISYETNTDALRALEKGYVGWVRDGKTNTFWLGDGNNDIPISEYDRIENAARKIKKKNPQYKFITDYDKNETRWFG